MRLHLIILTLALVASSPGVPPDTTEAAIVLEDFEEDQPGNWPQNWRFLAGRDRTFKPLDSFMSEKEKFYVKAERGNKFVRAYTEAEAQRVSLPSSRLDWSLSEFPRLSWEWRAIRLPVGAREDYVNDTGGAVYVSFAKTDWLGRPLSIKYTYSTSLPVGTEVSTGNVKIIVVSSGADGTGNWVRIERNVLDDYQRLFGEAPTEDPYTVTLWSDSDDTKSIGEVDFDNLTIRRGGK